MQLRHAQTEQQLQAAKNEAAALAIQLANLKEENTRNLERVRQVAEEANQIENQRLKDEIESLRQERDQIRRELNNAEEQLGLARSTIDTLEKQLRDLVDAVEDEKLANEQKLAELTSEVGRLNGLISGHESSINQYEVQIDYLNKKYEQDMQEAVNNLDFYKKKKRDDDDANSGAQATLQQTVQNWQARYDQDIGERNQQLEHQAKIIAGLLTEQNKRLTEIANLRSQIEAHLQAVKDKDDAMEEVSEEEAVADLLYELYQELLQKVTVSNALSPETKQIIATQQRSFGDTAVAGNQIKMLRLMGDKLLSQVEAALIDKDQQVATIQQQLDELTADNESLVGERDRALAHVQGLNNQLQDVQQVQSDTIAQLTSVREQSIKLQTELLAIAGQMGALKQENYVLNTTVNDLRNEIIAVQQKAQVELEAAQRAAQAAAINSMRGYVEDLDAETQRLFDIFMTQGKGVEYQKLKNSLQGRLEAQVKELKAGHEQALAAEVLRMQKKIDDAEAEYTAKRVAYQNLEAAKQQVESELRAELEKHKSIVQDLTHRLQQTEAQVKNAYIAFDILGKELGGIKGDDPGRVLNLVEEHKQKFDLVAKLSKKDVVNIPPSNRMQVDGLEEPAPEDVEGVERRAKRSKRSFSVYEEGPSRWTGIPDDDEIAQIVDRINEDRAASVPAPNVSFEFPAKPEPNTSVPPPEAPITLRKEPITKSRRINLKELTSPYERRKPREFKRRKEELKEILDAIIPEGASPPPIVSKPNFFAQLTAAPPQLVQQEMDADFT